MVCASGEEKVSGSVWCVFFVCLFIYFFILKFKNASRNQRGRTVTGNRARSCAQARPPPCTNASSETLPVPPFPQHLTGISAALRHSLLSSLPFHQNIADEVLSSINHSAAPLHSPSINQQLCRLSGGARPALCRRRMC